MPLLLVVMPLLLVARVANETFFCGLCQSVLKGELLLFWKPTASSSYFSPGPAKKVFSSVVTGGGIPKWAKRSEAFKNALFTCNGLQPSSNGLQPNSFTLFLVFPLLKPSDRSFFSLFLRELCDSFCLESGHTWTFASRWGVSRPWGWDTTQDAYLS